jgi:hypothetical protein
MHLDCLICTLRTPNPTPNTPTPKTLQQNSSTKGERAIEKERESDWCSTPIRVVLFEYHPDLIQD